MRTHEKKHPTGRSYLYITLLGLLAGVITRLTDFFPSDTLWSLSSIATLFGFWIVTATFVIYFSSSNLNAAVNVFLYLFAMSFSFYFLQYVLGFFLPRFDNDGFKFVLFGLYTLMSLVCGGLSYVLYFWNKKNLFNSVLYALPVGGLAAETIGVGLYLFHNHTFLFQFIFDLIGTGVIGILFCRKVSSKVLYTVTVFVVSVVGYAFFYRPFL